MSYWRLCCLPKEKVGNMTQRSNNDFPAVCFSSNSRRFSILGPESNGCMIEYGARLVCLLVFLIGGFTPFLARAQDQARDATAPEAAEEVSVVKPYRAVRTDNPRQTLISFFELQSERTSSQDQSAFASESVVKESRTGSVIFPEREHSICSLS